MCTRKEELEFAIFCIENLAQRFHVTGTEMYDVLAKKSRILQDYIIPEYGVLHTQSKEYILDELSDVMAERGVGMGTQPEVMPERELGSEAHLEALPEQGVRV